MRLNTNEENEVILNHHTDAQWRRREQELVQWAEREKKRKHAKKTTLLGHIHVDEELFPALMLLRQKQIATEFSCAGVSPLDEPEDHSLYAYLTIIASERAEQFIQLTMKRMRHRVLISFEPKRNRYDLSSFYIGHNRSFCQLIQQCAEFFENEG
ncbi:hypothetical protein [Paenibacillus sp. Soil787]|uniref:hypothetical protein n=1 Tax=Paenibacillus sp. Soil787 TaxID=1736411 RepID=UPI0006FABC94|nr:hypothetical protein [Paenibacillus sp. Soil787]KRF42752.1 hypothetical protein ASG93_19465 [Paenibacillus sp. Soil787]